jgi:hypothetical protein
MINESIAASYVMDFVQGLSIFFATIFRTMAVNDTIATRTAEDVYFIFGLLKYFSDFVAHHIYYVYNNTTMMQYSVGIWQKVAKNSTAIFGDYAANQGLAHIWYLGYQCIQPGNYCETKGPETTYWTLQLFKWLFEGLGKVGEKFSQVYT